ncbi:MAG: hypothetical protein JKY65_06295 [Planctomycetes bacterium]|nr:hypothetical protein [Planctomycetota bacterium]
MDSLRCPYCHAGLEGQAIAYCPSCMTPHHTLCFNEGGCTVLGCVAPPPTARGWNDRPHRGLGRGLVVLSGAILLLLAWNLSRQGEAGWRHLVGEASVASCCRHKGLQPTQWEAKGQGFAWRWDYDQKAPAVIKVAPGSAADLAGLRVDDRITHFGGVPAWEHEFPLVGRWHHAEWPRFRRLERLPGGIVRALDVTQPALLWQVWVMRLGLLGALLLGPLGVYLWTKRGSTRAQIVGGSPERGGLVEERSSEPKTAKGGEQE